MQHLVGGVSGFERCMDELLRGPHYCLLLLNTEMTGSRLNYLDPKQGAVMGKHALPIPTLTYPPTEFRRPGLLAGGAWPIAILGLPNAMRQHIGSHDVSSCLKCGLRNP